MAKCNFDISFQGSAEQLLSKAATAIEDAGGLFTAANNSGSFEVPSPIGKIAGDFTVNGNVFRIAITRKPLLVSCSTIQAKLQEYINV